jgi:hypothetical protein
MTTTAAKPHLARNIVIAVVIIIGVVGLVGYLASRPGGIVERYPRVTVTGTVETVGFGTSPLRVNFKNIKTGEMFTAPVEKGRYSIALPNRASYEVTVDWSGIGGITSGTAKAGILNLNVDADTYTYNIRA